MQKKRITILGVPFDPVTLLSAFVFVQEYLSTGKKCHIATPNPEMLLAARKNFDFMQVLRNTALNIPDGAGIVFASRFLKWRGRTPIALSRRVTGTDFFEYICRHTCEPIFLLGAAEGVAKKVKRRFEKRFPEVNIVGTYSGSPSPAEELAICKKINDSGARILFVAFGAPKQEIWISRNVQHLEHVSVAIGVGGAFDFFAGVRKRAPKWVQNFHLEWLFRLIQEPKRIKRIWNAVIVFPFVVLFPKR